MLSRREFIGASAAVALSGADAEAPAKIIDTHVHFYDPSRPQGVPWPPKDDKLLYRTVLPAEFRRMAEPLGVTGVIEVEASPWLEDNQWVLDLAEREPIIVGTVGDLQPGAPDFRKHLNRFRKNRRFRGIRCGNLWGRELGADIENPDFISDLKFMAGAGLEMDTANPDPALIADVLRLTARVPTLRVVIDHLPIDMPREAQMRHKYERALRELGRRSQVYVKVSNVPRVVNGKVREDINYYRPALDHLWEIFGPDRLIYGSNWPVSGHVAPYSVALGIVREYFATKGRAASEKYFWRNATIAYGLSQGAG
ncbi:MAG TPA: amidohydrolase family protein [Bryobacteraceae bacterium]|jgi:predicted TIM-barrel fold metal-dependent hydrolase|nr:amidohydrolase family protein [Bryobacteraceae bacterium]